MKNLFKFVFIIAFLTGALAFAQQKKPVIKLIYCKKVTVSVSIGIASVESDVVVCYVTVNGWPAVIGGKQQVSNTNEVDNAKLDYVYVDENEMIRAFNLKDPKELDDIKFIKSGIWDYEGVSYTLNSSIKHEVIDLDGIKYYAIPVQVNE
jgi:hypothetical protein